jgi:hypothetical protein
VGGPETEGQAIEVKAMSVNMAGADFQSRFDKTTAQAVQMTKRALRTNLHNTYNIASAMSGFCETI